MLSLSRCPFTGFFMDFMYLQRVHVQKNQIQILNVCSEGDGIYRNILGSAVEKVPLVLHSEEDLVTGGGAGLNESEVGLQRSVSGLLMMMMMMMTLGCRSG